MNEPIQLPPQHANAPTPRTDAETGHWNSLGQWETHSNDWSVKSDYARLLEREQQYMMEVVENIHQHPTCTLACLFNQTTSPGYKCECGHEAALTAYNNLKAYMEQKK